MKFWLILFYWIPLSAIFGQSKADFISRLADLDRFVENQLDTWKNPGCAIAIVYKDQIIYSKGYGYRDVAHQLPANEHTLFAIASCTKAFTSSALGLLVAEKKISWDEPVKKYLPDLKMYNDELTGNLTIRDILSHRSGLPRYDEAWFGEKVTPSYLYSHLPEFAPTKRLREGYIYNNWMFVLAGDLIAHLYQLPYRVVISNKFFKPLGMDRTQFSFDPVDHPGESNYAIGYTYDREKSAFRPQPFYVGGETFEPAGAITSTVTDMSKWLRMHINGGDYQGETILPQQIVKEIRKPINLMDEDQRWPEYFNTFYAMGWWTNTYRGHTLSAHTGGLGGFRAYTSYMPFDSIGVIVLQNGTNRPMYQAITYRIYDLLLNLPAIDWTSRFMPDQLKSIEDEKQEYLKSLPTQILNTTARLPIAAYAGEFEHPMAGKIALLLDHDQLYYVHHAMPRVLLTHYHYDTWRYEDPSDGNFGFITFDFNAKGTVESLKLLDQKTAYRKISK